MLGAIVGDVVGSRFEWDNLKSKEFELFKPPCHATDDSVMTIAIGNALLSSDKYGYILPFEAVSILLLACIIGGIMIARKR